MTRFHSTCLFSTIRPRGFRTTNLAFSASRTGRKHDRAVLTHVCLDEPLTHVCFGAPSSRMRIGTDACPGIPGSV
jgi:hypothetical protein